jgi:hypothetical protein
VPFDDLYLFAKAIHTGMTGQQQNELFLKYLPSSKLNFVKANEKVHAETSTIIRQGFS